MRSDTPQAVTGALALIDDQIDEMLPAYTEAQGFMASWAMEHRKMFLVAKAELEAKEAFKGVGTETGKKDIVDKYLLEAYPQKFAEAERHARNAAIGSALFKGLDTRRSIGQSILKVHMDRSSGFGQGDTGQVGQ